MDIRYVIPDMKENRSLFATGTSLPFKNLTYSMAKGGTCLKRSNLGCVRLGNLHLDFKIRISDNQQKEDPCLREQFCKSFFRFPNGTVKRKSMTSGFGFFLLESTLRTDFSEVKSVLAFDSKFQNRDFPIERNLSNLSRYNLSN